MTTASTGSVEDLRDLDRDPLIAVDDKNPVVIPRHLKGDGALVDEPAVVLVHAVVAVRPVGVGVHEADPRGRAAQAHLEDGAAGAGPEVPVEVLHPLFVADLHVRRYGLALGLGWLWIQIGTVLYSVQVFAQVNWGGGQATTASPTAEA